MTQDEFIEARNKDSYLKERKDPTEAELRLYLREVNFHCPLCGKELQSISQKKLNEKLFQIAHIYPNKPTKEQYENLLNLERLGRDSESFENKIALCKDCHGTQDFHTTAEDYLILLNIKKQKLEATILHDITYNLSLETGISHVVEALARINEEEISKLNYVAVPLKKKFNSNDLTLKTKIAGYISVFFPYIRELFRNMEGKNHFVFSALSGQIKTCFLKVESESQDKVTVFNQLVDWISLKTNASSREACEILVSYFVQSCEVFHEIS